MLVYHSTYEYIQRQEETLTQASLHSHKMMVLASVFPRAGVARGKTGTVKCTALNTCTPQTSDHR